jgi:Protein of unknown function (DUF4199)
MLKKYPLVAVALRNGAIAGVLGFILLIGLYYLGRHPFLIPVFMDFRVVLFGVMLFFSLKEYRDFYRQGYLLFWEGMVLAALFTVIFAVIAATLLFAFASWRTEFVSSYITLTQEQMKGIPPEIIDRIGKATFEHNLEILPTTRAIDLAVLYFGQSFVISFFISIIISVILRRQPKQP